MAYVLGKEIQGEILNVENARKHTSEVETLAATNITRSVQVILDEGRLTKANCVDVALVTLYENEIINVYERVRPAWHSIMKNLTGPNGHFLWYEKIEREESDWNDDSGRLSYFKVESDVFAVGALAHRHVPFKIENKDVRLNTKAAQISKHQHIVSGNNRSFNDKKEPEITNTPLLGWRRGRRDSIIDHVSGGVNFPGILMGIGSTDPGPVLFTSGSSSKLLERQVMSDTDSIAEFFTNGKTELYMAYRAACRQQGVAPIEPPNDECATLLERKRLHLRTQAERTRQSLESREEVLAKAEELEKSAALI